MGLRDLWQSEALSRWALCPALPCRYSGRTDAGSLYELTVRLLSEHEDVLAEFNTGQVAVPEDGSWMEVILLGRGGRDGTFRVERVETPSAAFGR